MSGSTSTSLTSCANSACYLCESFKCRAKEFVRRVLSLCSAKPRHNPAFAEKLVLSPKTVRNHVSNIFSKLQVAGRAEAIIRARDAGLT